MINATPETIRAVGKAWKLAGLLDDRVTEPAPARVAAWAEQVQRHNLPESDLLDGVQAFYDQPSTHAMQIGDLINHARAIKRNRLDREPDANREARQDAQERKAAETLATIAATARTGPAGPPESTDRLRAARARLQTCRGREESRSAIGEYRAALAAAPQAGPQ